MQLRSPTVTLIVPLLQFEKLAPYKPCQFRSNETIKETCWNCGFKERSVVSHTLLKKGFWIYNFISAHKNNNLFSFLFTFLLPCVHMRMKCHNYNLTLRLKHKESHYTMKKWRKKIKKGCRNGLQSVNIYYNFITVCGELQPNKCLSFFAIPFSHHQKRAKQTNKTKNLNCITSLFFSLWHWFLYIV